MMHDMPARDTKSAKSAKCVKPNVSRPVAPLAQAHEDSRRADAAMVRAHERATRAAELLSAAQAALRDASRARDAADRAASAARAKSDEVRAISIAEADARTDVVPSHGAETTEGGES